MGLQGISNYLILKVPVTPVAEDTFDFFSEEASLDISCEWLPNRRVTLNVKTYFHCKIKQKVRLLQILLGALKVKIVPTVV